MPYKVLVSHLKPLLQAKSQDEILERATRIAYEMGFKYFSAVSRSLNDDLQPDASVYHNYPEEWEDIYSDRGYFLKDPANTLAVLSQPAYVWPLENANEVMKAASDFGIRSGITSAIRSQGRICSISFSTSESRICDERLIAAQFIAPYISNALLNSAPQIPESKKNYYLSDREKECLRWVCAGKTSWEISVILAISERTVLFHLANVQKKLETSGRAHSVAKCTLLGLLDDTILECDPFT